jgi:molybdenum cofactor guanylyltransferase
MQVLREQITGLVLAGGRGERMGGADKGLLDWHGEPLAQRVLRRLAAQVGPMLISANRHPERYAAFGVPVLADDSGSDAGSGFAGPLAGFLAGLRAARTPLLMAVPCDAPDFPLDLVARLADALTVSAADVAVPTLSSEAGPRPQPVFCLMRTAAVGRSIEQALADGHHKVGRWLQAQKHTSVAFADAAAFRNLNTPDDLR